ncbi:MAG TPA: HAD family phosphatase [Patescibacteria group bacterium]|nr:HAD family phosphatase [Patescibacteria group bacterium]
MSTVDPSLVRGIEAVIFDLDGVLVDTEPWWHEVRAEWAAARGRPWREEDSRLCMGRNSREWSAVMRERLGVPEEPVAIERAIVGGLVARFASEPVPLVADAPAAATKIAARVPVAIASSAHPAVIRAALEAAGLESLFATIVSSDDVARGKPAPDVFLEAARRLGAQPGQCLVIEDSRNGVLAGRAAGMRVVLIPNASVPPGPGVAEIADAVLERLADLPVAFLGAAA